MYIQDYEKAWDNFQKAKQLDPAMDIPEIAKLEQQNTTIFNLMSAKANLKAKQIDAITKTIIPESLKVNQGNKEFKFLKISDTKEETYDGHFIICKVVKIVSDSDSPVR
jgi:hypothetical protein